MTKTFENAMKKGTKLREQGHSVSEVVDILNKAGFSSKRGKDFNEANLGLALREYAKGAKNREPDEDQEEEEEEEAKPAKATKTPKSVGDSSIDVAITILQSKKVPAEHRKAMALKILGE